MIKLNSSRRYTFDYVVENEDTKAKEVECSITFDFPFAENTDNSDVHKILRDRMKELKIDVKDVKDKQEVLITPDLVQSLQYKRMRESIVGWDGICNEKEEALILNEQNQKIVFEFVKGTYLWADIEQAYLGLEIKN